MSRDVSASVSDGRERVVLFLAFLSSDVCRDACRRHAAPEELAATLCRLWFDEIYVPGERYLYGLKGDRAEEDVRRFAACFTEDERAALERFHGCFELRLDLAANRARGRAFIPENDSWRSLVRDATRLLADLDPDAERLRGLLEAFVVRLTEEGATALLAPLRDPRLLT